MRYMAIAVAMLLSGCAIRGPETIVDSRGISTRNPGVVAGGLVDVFRLNYNAAMCSAARDRKFCSSDVQYDSVKNLTGGALKTRRAQDSYAMVVVGSNLSVQLCLDFFKEAGREQQMVIFGKDFLGIAGALAATFISATSGSAAAVTWTGLATTGGIAGLNLYQRNFLFSSDNIDAVETLIRKAIVAAAAVAQDRDPDTYYDFGNAIGALTDVQRVCEVQNILSQVRTAISGSSALATDALESASSVSLTTARGALGQMLTNNFVITEDQLVGLYWVLVDGRKLDDPVFRSRAIQLMGGLKTSPYNSDGITRNANFDTQAPGARAQFRMSSRDLQYLKGKVTAIVGDAAPAPAPAPAPATDASQSPGQGATTDTSGAATTLSSGKASGPSNITVKINDK